MAEYTLEDIKAIFISNPNFADFITKFKEKMEEWEYSVIWLKALCNGKLAGDAFNYMCFTIREYSIGNSTMDIGLYNLEIDETEVMSIKLPFFKVMLANGMVFDINESTNDLILNLGMYIDKILQGADVCKN